LPENLHRVVYPWDNEVNLWMFTVTGGIPIGAANVVDSIGAYVKPIVQQAVTSQQSGEEGKSTELPHLKLYLSLRIRSTIASFHATRSCK